MLLITEHTDDIKIIAEDVEGKKRLYIEGVFLQAGIKNKNGRLYPPEIMGAEVARYMNETVSKGRAYGELGHPQGPAINLDRVSHLIIELRQDGNNFIGKARIAETPMGDIAKGLMNTGAKLGVSSRGLGSLVQKNEINEVQKDFRLCTAADIVADPSAPDAYVDGIMEQKEWIWDNGILKEAEIKKVYDEIKATPKMSLAEAKAKAFADFLKKLNS